MLKDLIEKNNSSKESKSNGRRECPVFAHINNYLRFIDPSTTKLIVNTANTVVLTVSPSRQKLRL